MIKFIIILIVFLILLIIYLLFLRNKEINYNQQTTILPNKLELTKRNYSGCKYKININDIKNINKYFTNNSQKIPKIIHQIWIGNKDIPYNWINTIKFDFIKKYPEYQYILWTEKDIKNLKLHNKKLYEKETSYAGKADILRYEILYNFGGIYIDADTIFIENNFDFNKLMSKVNNSGFFIAEEFIDRKGLANSVIGCSKNNPIMKLIINTINTKNCKDVGAYKKFGPYLMDQVILPGLNVTIFPSKYFYPEHWDGPQKFDYKNLQDSCFYQFGYSTNELFNKINLFQIEFKNIILSFDEKYKNKKYDIIQTTILKEININNFENKNIIMKNLKEYDCYPIILSKLLRNNIYIFTNQTEFLESCIKINFVNNIIINFDIKNLQNFIII